MMKRITVSENRTFRQGKTLISLLAVPGILFIVFLIPSSSLPLVSLPLANAVIIQTQDEDIDILPDIFESLRGTSYINPDTDGDEFIDGIEYIFRSDPFDPLDTPDYQPEVRIATYQSGSSVKLHMSFFPGDADLLDSFVCYLAYPIGGNSSIGEVGKFDLTSLIPQAVTEVSFVVFDGFLISSYVISIPVLLLEKLAPVSIGVGAEVSGVFVTEIVNLDFIDGQMVQLLSGDDAGLGENEGYYQLLTLEPPMGWSEDQVCKTDMEVKESHDGITTYEITDAQCNALLRQLCSPSECEGLIGTEYVSIDPGFLAPGN